MVAIQVPSFLESVVGLGAFYVLYCIYWELTVGAKRRQIIKDRGCKPIPRVPDYEPFFGIRVFLENMKHLKSHSILDLGLRRWKSMKTNTFEIVSAGQTLTISMEPENIKHVLALQFKNFGLGERRKRSFLPLLGPGIFCTDGAQWQHSRDMLRPNFVRSQVGDLNTFEDHISNLIKNIPRDGSTVDLGALFFRLTIDSATEFLFGESTHCLIPGQAVERNIQFAEAFNRGQDTISRRARFGKFARNAGNQFQKDCKTVHGKFLLPFLLVFSSFRAFLLTLIRLC